MGKNKKGFLQAPGWFFVQNYDVGLDTCISGISQLGWIRP